MSIRTKSSWEKTMAGLRGARLASCWHAFRLKAFKSSTWPAAGLFASCFARASWNNSPGRRMGDTSPGLRMAWGHFGILPSYHLKPARLYASARVTDITALRIGCPIHSISFTPAVLYRQPAVMRNFGWHLWVGRSARWFMLRRAAIFMEVALRRTGSLSMGTGRRRRIGLAEKTGTGETQRRPDSRD